MNLYESADDTVYHLTAADSIAVIDSRGGLESNPHARKTEDGLNIDLLMDEVRPQNIRQLGISRRDSIFAHPDLEHLHEESMGAYGVAKNGIRAALEIRVDPASVIVADASIYDKLHDSVAVARSTNRPTDARQLAQNYWEGSMSLADFRANYSLAQPNYDGEYERSDKADPSLPSYFELPEVLIPGMVPADQITWTASIVPQK